MEDSIFISENTPSSKNSKQRTRAGFIVHSKQCQTYYKNTKQEWIDNKDVFHELIKDKEFPLRVSFKFIRKSKHKFDYPNPLQTILDQMVKYEWMEDDNADVILPSFEVYEYDKENPGCYITVL